MEVPPKLPQSWKENWPQTIMVQIACSEALLALTHLILNCSDVVPL